MPAVIETILDVVVRFGMKHFGATQLCWLCLVSTVAGGWFFTTHNATAADVELIRTGLVETRGDAIAKRIYDYRVRQCDTPIDQRDQKRWLVDQIRTDVEKYRKVTGEPFSLPACSDL